MWILIHQLNQVVFASAFDLCELVNRQIEKINIMRAKNGSIIGKRNWWTTSKHKHTKRRCGTRRPVSCVSLLQRSPGTRYCGNERASAVRAGLYILNKKSVCMHVCGGARMPAGGREVSEEAFRKALIAVPLFSPAVTPSSALRLSSLITHRKYNTN